MLANEMSRSYAKRTEASEKKTDSLWNRNVETYGQVFTEIHEIAPYGYSTKVQGTYELKSLVESGVGHRPNLHEVKQQRAQVP